MMKKILLLGLAVCITACQEDAPQPAEKSSLAKEAEQEVRNVSTAELPQASVTITPVLSDTMTEALAVSSSVTDEKAQVSEPESEQSYEALAAAGEALMATETIGELKLGLTALEVVNLLGAPVEKSEKLLSDADGETHQDYIYTNQGLSLNLIGDAEQTVVSIKALSPNQWQTKRGMSIGSSFDAVKAAYHDVINLEESSYMPDTLVVGSLYGGLIFEFTDGKVSSIYLGAGAE